MLNLLFKFLQVSADVRAVSQGKIIQRIGRRATFKTAGRVSRKLFK